MKIITRKSEITPILTELEKINLPEDMDLFKLEVKEGILVNKIKFPLLEYFSSTISELIPFDHQLTFLDWLAEEDYIGSYVVIGKILQIRMSSNLIDAIDNAVKYIEKGDKWYSCDIISERVFGESLLLNFDRAFSKLSDLSIHCNPWVKRGVGIAVHYATKRKVNRVKAGKLLELTLSKITDSHKEVKRGFGWGLKTLAKFHPDMVLDKKERIVKPGVSKHYTTKMNIGLRLSRIKAD